MKINQFIKYPFLTLIAAFALNPTLVSADDYWWVKCKNMDYGVDFNIKMQRAFLIIKVEPSGGTIPAASTTKIIKQVISADEKYAIFDFGSETKIGVNISDPNRTIIYRHLLGNSYPLCNATASIK